MSAFLVAPLVFTALAANAGQPQSQGSASPTAAGQTTGANGERNIQALQEQANQAQAEINQVKEMVAKDSLAPVTFKTGSADLKATSHPALAKVIGIAKKYPNLKLRVEVHTNNIGHADYNLTLSQHRADAVKTYLSTHGIPPDQIIAIGFGVTQPIASNSTPEGRNKNRRVEFIFFL